MSKLMREELLKKMTGYGVHGATLRIYDENGGLHELEYHFYNRFHRFGVETSPTKIYPETRFCQFNSWDKAPCQCANSRACEMCLRKNIGFEPKSTEEFFVVVNRLASFKNDFGNFKWDELEEGEKRFVSLFKCEESEIVELDFQLVHKSDKYYKFRFEGKIYEFKIS